jgi:hypothetical protein
VKLFQILILLLIQISSFAQTVKEREDDLLSQKAEEEWGGKRQQALELLSIDKFNIVAIDYLLRLYYKADQKDSIIIFYENLINSNKNSPIPYLIRVKLAWNRYESLSASEEFSYLKKAYLLDSNNIEINYMLGDNAYYTFNKEFKDHGQIDTIEKYANISIVFFTNLFNYNKEYREWLKFPLIQLTNYTCDSVNNLKFKNYHQQHLFFPVEALLGLPNGWETNYNIDVMNYSVNFAPLGVASAYGKIQSLGKFLTALEEPVLRDSLPGLIYRFTWLRSFDNPIVIGLINNNNHCSLYWKVSDGAGGYEPGKLVINKSRELTQKECNGFIRKVNSMKFWDIATPDSEAPGFDGAEWVLEGKEPMHYHFVYRWSDSEIKGICLELLKMTDLEIEEMNIY